MDKKEDKRHENSGRKFDQKMKPFLIYQYLMQETDEEHFETIKSIKEYLDENFGISAERRSIYRDIHEINKALLALQEYITLEEAEELLREDEENKIIRNHKRKGFYVVQRKYDEEDIRLLAECVFTAKFVDDKRAEKLADVVFQLVSRHQAEKMNHRAIVKNRVKTSNTKVYYIVNTIYEAIGKGGRDTRKIKFKYLKHTLKDVRQQVEMRSGADYIVIPYSLIIDNGNYYLLGYDEKKNGMRTFRVDRMMKVNILKEYNPTETLFKDIDLDGYVKEHFGMFGGRYERVKLTCANRLLETMIDRFGTDGMAYIPAGKNHFEIRANIYISEQFFGWVSGFGRMIQITAPLNVREEYAEYLKKITAWHSQPIEDK